MSEEYKKILFDCLKVDPTQRPSLSQLLEYSWCSKFTNANNVSSSEASSTPTTTNTTSKTNKKSTTKSNS
jgi:serine/threonine protein kinase